MNATHYYKIAKIALFIPLITGLITIVEQFLPLQEVTTTVEYKHTSNNAKFSGTTYSIDFVNNNDQFTEEIYNSVMEGDTVNLKVLYFSKEVKTIQPINSKVVMENNTNEYIAHLGIALVMIGFSVYFIRRKYYTNKNYRYIIFVCIFGLASLIRIINLNT